MFVLVSEYCVDMFLLVNWYGIDMFVLVSEYCVDIFVLVNEYCVDMFVLVTDPSELVCCRHVSPSSLAGWYFKVFIVFLNLHSIPLLCSLVKRRRKKRNRPLAYLGW